MGNTRRLGKKQSIETKLKISLANKGRKHPNKGGTISDEIKEKISLALKGKRGSWMYRTPSRETKDKLSDISKKTWNNLVKRKKYLDALEKTRWIKVRTDIGQLDLIQKWNRLGFNFEPNYQIKTDTDLFYIDGYDKEKNVVLEYDSKYHNKRQQKEKDLVRQQKIIDILKPKKFWRYDSMNKMFNNITQ